MFVCLWRRSVSQLWTILKWDLLLNCQQKISLPAVQCPLTSGLKQIRIRTHSTKKTINIQTRMMKIRLSYTPKLFIQITHYLFHALCTAQTLRSTCFNHSLPSSFRLPDLHNKEERASLRLAILPLGWLPPPFSLRFLQICGCER